MKVVVEPHNPQWADMFDMESNIVRQVLGSNAVVIHHIGSTAIPSIHAKPIIDMLIGVADINAVDIRTSAIEAISYEAMGECGIPGRRYFRKNNEMGDRVYQVHMFTADSPQIERHLAFRDFMRADPDWAKRYSDLKRDLANAYPHSIERYMDGKDAFIKEIDRKAAAWRDGPAA